MLQSGFQLFIGIRNLIVLYQAKLAFDSDFSISVSSIGDVSSPDAANPQPDFVFLPEEKRSKLEFDQVRVSGEADGNALVSAGRP